MCDRVVSEDPFFILYCPDKNKTQTMCNKPVDDCLSVFKTILDSFVKSKMLERFHNALHDDIPFYNDDFDKVTFTANQRHVLAAGFDQIYLDHDNNFDEDHTDSIIPVRLFARYIKFQKRKVLKKKMSKLKDKN